MQGRLFSRTILNMMLFLSLVMGLGSALQAEVQTQQVRYEHDGVALEGFLAFDDALTEKRPGVLVVHEWWGLNDYARGRAKQLAEMGYVAFAVDMYGQGKTTQDPKQASHWSGQFKGNQLMRDRAAAGLEVLAKHERVDHQRIAAIGYCFGATTVMQLAYGGAPVKAVVSFHGSLPIPDEHVTGDQVKAKILVCHGGADPFITPKHAAAFDQALKDLGLNYNMVVYDGVKHSFTNPNADQFGIDGIAYDQHADQDSWEKMKTLFSEVLSE